MNYPMAGIAAEIEVSASPTRCHDVVQTIIQIAEPIYVLVHRSDKKAKSTQNLLCPSSLPVSKAGGKASFQFKQDSCFTPQEIFCFTFGGRSVSRAYLPVVLRQISDRLDLIKQLIELGASHVGSQGTGQQSLNCSLWFGSAVLL